MMYGGARHSAYEQSCSTAGRPTASDEPSSSEPNDTDSCAEEIAAAERASIVRFSDKFIVTRDGIFGAGRAITFVNIESVIVDMQEGNDVAYVMSTNPGVQTAVYEYWLSKRRRDVEQLPMLTRLRQEAAQMRVRQVESEMS